MISNLMARRVAAVALGAATVAFAPAAAASAAAGHTDTETQTVHGTQTSTDVQPCNGDPVDITTETNAVFHLTTFTGSDELWFTFTEEDKATAVDQVTGVIYSGHNTVWGNENDNERNSNSTFTQSTHITGTDGSSFSYREVMHVTVLPSGQVAVSFDRPSLTCG